MNSLANYERERHAFQALLDPRCERRILMFRGASGSGKTALMGACRALVLSKLPYVAIDLRGTTVNVPEILSRSVVKLGGLPQLPGLARRLEALARVPSLSLADNTLSGTQSWIEVVIQNTVPVERGERYVQLTEAWLADLEQQERSLLLLLDTFERASQEVQDWIGGPLLGRTADTGVLWVALAGQRVPEARIDWEHCCQVLDLYGVWEAEHWLPVVEALGHRVPVDPPLAYLAGICHAHEGHPGRILQTIRAFPRRH
jgi:hypothetical protein